MTTSVVSNNAGPTVVIADAVQFVYIESQDFPSGPAIPTWWQNFYFGSPVDQTLDPDADGYSTAQEYIMGTTPTNSESHLQVASQPGSSNTTSVTFWPLLGNRAYDLLFRTDIGAPSWQKAPAGPITPLSDGHGAFTLSTTNDPQSFFRLKIQMSTNNSFSGSFAAPAGNSFAPFATEAFCGPNRAYIISK